MLRSNEGKGFQRLPPSTTGANIPVRVRQQPGASRGLVEQREKESYRIENANCKIVDRLLSIHSRPRPVPKEHKPVKKRSSIKELERAREIKRENERLLKRIQKNSSKATKTIDGTTISDIKGKDYQIALKRMDMISMYPQQAATRSPRVFGQKREKAIDQQHHPGEQDFDGEEGKEVNHQEEEYDLDPAYLEKPYTASDHEDYSQQCDDEKFFHEDQEHQQEAGEYESDTSKFSSVFREEANSSVNSSHYYWDEFE